MIRSCGWWVYIVYLPIFAIEQGLGEQVGGLVLSFSNGCLFLAPVILRWVRRQSLRRAVRGAFAAACLCFGAAAAVSEIYLAATWPGPHSHGTRARAHRAAARRAA